MFSLEIVMKSKSVTKAKDMGVVKYTIHNVAGDGHCFYRALFQIFQNAPSHIFDMVAVHDIEDEDDGVASIRKFVAASIKKRTHVESITTIDSLCSLIQTADESDRGMLLEQLNEMYPFVVDEVCLKKGVRRYKEVADMVENMRDPMYASSLEIDLMKSVLANQDIALLTISANGHLRTAEKKFYYDLGKLLENTHVKHVAVLLNRNNVHYQYLMFKAPDDEEYSAIVNRAKLLHMIRMNEIASNSGKLSLMSAGGKRKK